MTVLALSICLFIMAFAAVGVISPQHFIESIRRMTSLRGFYFIALVRITLGLVLLLAAPASRAPRLVEVIGVVVIVAGVLTPLFSHERYRRVVDWWVEGGAVYIRAWAACAFLLMGALAFVLLPP